MRGRQVGLLVRSERLKVRVGWIWLHVIGEIQITLSALVIDLNNKVRPSAVTGDPVDQARFEAKNL